jgi:hypothetical protein
MGTRPYSARLETFLKEKSAMQEDDERYIRALRALPYSEYLKTEHWQRQRRSALARAAYRCQVCNTNALPLEVHHRTYARLGCELPSDLFVLCETCHELFSMHGKLAKPRMEPLLPRRQIPYLDGEDDDSDWDEDEMALVPANSSHPLLAYAMHHPRLSLGGGSMLLSLVIDIAVRFDSFAVIIGLGAAVAIGWNGEQLALGIQEMLLPGSNQAQVQEDADRFAEDFLGDYPMHPDQRPLSKLKRLFKIDQIVEASSRKEVLPHNQERAKRSIANQEEGLTYARIAEWFEEGRIDDTQFFTLLERIDNKKVISPAKTSSSSSSSSLPSDWTEKEARMARELAKEVKDKDTIIRLLEKKGTIANRRKELKAILQEEDE